VEKEGIVGALDLPIFPNQIFPTKLYIIIPNKQTLTPGLDTYPNPNPSLSPNPSPSSCISQEMTVHEMPVQYLTVQLVSVQEDTWQYAKCCWSRIWRSRKCLDIRFSIDLRRIESQEWSQHANWSDQLQTHPNNSTV